MEWNKELTLHIIELWEQHPCLYNPKNGLYHNKHARIDAFESITNQMAAFVGSITVEDVKTKLTNLRSQYNHELVKSKNSKKSGAGTADVYEPNIYWFSKLSFLKQFIKQRKSVSNIEKSFTDTEEGLNNLLEIEYCSESLDSLANSPPFPESKPSTPRLPKRRVPTDDVLSEASQAIRSLTASVTEQKYSKDIEAFGEHIKAEMCKISNEELRDEAMFEFNNIMYQIKKKQRLLNN